MVLNLYKTFKSKASSSRPFLTYSLHVCLFSDKEYFLDNLKESFLKQNRVFCSIFQK